MIGLSSAATRATGFPGRRASLLRVERLEQLVRLAAGYGERLAAAEGHLDDQYMPARHARLLTAHGHSCYVYRHETARPMTKYITFLNVCFRC